MTESHDVNVLNFYSGDSFSQLALERIRYGLRALSTSLHNEGFNNQVDAFLWPEFSITRNTFKWHEGLAHGLFVGWHETGDPFVPISNRPNACGTLVAVIPQRSTSEVQEMMNDWDPEAFFSRGDINLVPGDLSRRNHFIAIGSLENDGGKTVVIIHNSPAKYKASGPNWSGLYPERSSWPERSIRSTKHTDMRFFYMIGQDAEDYMNEYRIAESVSKKSRIQLAGDIFGKIEIISNNTHQGVGSNFIHLGCSVNPDKSIILGNNSGANSHIVSGISTLQEVAKMNGLHFRIDSLNSAKVCPHGVGITWVHDGEFASLQMATGTRLISMNTGDISHYYDNPASIEFRYRDHSIADATLQLLNAQERAVVENEFIYKI